MPWFIAVTLIGFGAAVYSVYKHHYPTTTKLPVWIFLLALTWVLIGYDVYNRHYSPGLFHELEKLEQVQDQHFINRTLEVDGKEFRHCTFTTCSFLYHGKSNFGFVDCRIDGTQLIYTDNQIAKWMLTLTRAFLMIPGGGTITTVNVDKSSGAVIEVKD